MIVRDEVGRTVRRRGLECLRGDLTAGARPVLDNHRCTQFVLESLGQRPRDGVGAAAGREPDQDLHRLAGLREGRAE